MSRSLFDPLAIQHQQNTPGGGGAAPPAEPPVAPPPAAPAPPPAAPAPTGSGQPGAAAPPPPPASPKAGQSFEEWLADPVNAEMTSKLRKENADWRTKFQTASKATQEQLRPLFTALGIEIPGDQLDPAALKAKVETLQRQNVELQVSAALEQASRKHGADTELLVPFLRGSAALEKLDPAAETFTADVSNLVKTLLEKNPKLRAGGLVPPRSGGGPPGGTPSVTQLTRDQLKGMKPEEIEAARQAGQLEMLLRGGV